MADKFSYMDMPLQIGFQFAGPLDKYVQFNSMAEANAWKDGALGYDGALVRIKTAESEDKLTTTWELYRVELENGNRVFKVIASDIKLDADGKLVNSYLHTTADGEDKANKVVVTEADGTIDFNLLGIDTTVEGGEGEGNKFVLTAEDGFVSTSVLNPTVKGGEGEEGKVILTDENGLIDNDILNSTVDTKVADKVVITDENGFVSTNLLNVTVAGGEGNAGKIAQLGADGKLAESMIPSIAIGEYLGKFESWGAFQDAITAGVDKNGKPVHAPENGDTVSIEEMVGEEARESVYICVDASKDTLSQKFVAVKSAAGAVTQGEFDGHVNNSEIHTSASEKASWDVKLDKEDIVAGENISIAYGEDGTVTITGDADPYVLPVADADTLGGVMIGENVNVTAEGVISVNNATATQKGLVQPGETLSIDANSVIDAKIATRTAAGIVKPGLTLSLGEDGLINAELATSTTAGIVKAGTALYIEDSAPGIINAQVATTEQLGVVKVGTNIGVVDGVISVATADNDTLGVVKTGDVAVTAVNVEEGLISVATATNVQRGAVVVGNNIDVTETGVISVKTGSKNDLGVLQVGDGLNVTAGGVVSLDETTLVGKLDKKYYILKSDETQEDFTLLSAADKEKYDGVADWYDKGNYVIPFGSKDKAGILQVGNNIDVTTEGVISVKTGSKDDFGVVKAGTNIDVTTEGVISVKTGSKDNLGLVKVGDNISVADGVISVATATDTTLGLVKAGTNVSIVDGAVNVATASADTLGVVKTGDVAETAINVEEGLISVADASKTQRGAVKVGDNINVTDGVISVAVASKTQLGLVKVGSGLNVATDGTISANILWAPDTLNLTEGEGVMYQEWEKVCEVKIFDEDGDLVFPASYKVVDGKTRIEFPADFPADGEDTTKWNILVGPAIQ